MTRISARNALAVLVLTTMSSPALAEPDAEVKSEKKICKIEQSTTSRIAARKVCKTADEWRLEAQRRQSAASDREDFLMRHEQESSGTRGVPADLRGN